MSSRTLTVIQNKFHLTVLFEDFFLKRQSYYETASCFRLARYFDCTVMHIDHFLYQWQTDAGRRLEHILLCQRFEALEQSTQFSRFNSDAFIHHRDCHFICLFCHFYCNRLLSRCIFECVGYQIKEYLFKLIAVYPCIYWFKFACQPEINLLFFCNQAEVDHYFFKKWNQVCLLHQHFHLLILYLTEVQNLIHET